ncbi:DUF805 domain-containing protein [Bartonella sp. HY329]|uniref:DUF805 domain-containing protein n=1 Tax=unclassified Bartonella TaxID=2645622 RepID=UPI0021C6BF18|nr:MULTISPECIES: DUF805 domain-containing protein [unclassified Bartonella]UXM95991.1 DUF805 domain-containing protein [Bartonella sp. HY329]UXN10316.1 DUF805 domain-containing protein [Bartonella sp. HY328]
MGPITAIRTVLFTKLFIYSGRASRAEFWWYVLFAMLVTWLYEKIEPRMFSSPIRGEPLARPDWLKPALSLNDLSDFILGAMLFIPFLSLTVRRLHDRNMTGWWGISLVVVYLNANNWFFLKLSPYLSLPDHQLFRGVVVFFRSVLMHF